MHNNAFKSNCVLLQLHPKMQCSSDVMSLHTGCRFAALSGGLPCLWLSCKTVCPMQKKPKQISFSQTSIAYLHGIFLPNFRILQLKKNFPTLHYLSACCTHVLQVTAAGLSLSPEQFMALAALLIAVITLPLSSAARGELTIIEHPVEASRPLRLLVIGDWGRKGRYNQSRVAKQVLFLEP